MGVTVIIFIPANIRSPFLFEFYLRNFMALDMVSFLFSLCLNNKVFSNVFFFYMKI